jgi:hypothetical protein
VRFHCGMMVVENFLTLFFPSHVAYKDAMRCVRRADRTAFATAGTERVNIMAATSVPRVPPDSVLLTEEDADVPIPVAIREPGTSSFVQRKSYFLFSSVIENLNFDKF